MKKVLIVLVAVMLFALVCVQVPASAYSQDCWGQATAAFARMGQMGSHASQQAEPRDGLAVLANYLYYEEGVLDAPTLQALGAYLVSIDPNLTVEACMD